MQGDPRIGTELAGHRIEAVIGRGPMAVVYLARHIRLGRRVALKVLDPALADDEAFRERFIRESRIAAGIEHPNIVTVYDAGEADGLLYVSMRYVEGTDLERLLEKRGRLRPEVVSIIVSRSAAALDAAHAEGLIHGGVRPAVILLERGPQATGRVFLSDFGITQHVASTTRLTRTGSFAGTVDYVAPEQIRGEGAIDGRADVYALGCVLYRCLVGEPPFPRESELVTIFAHLNDPPPRPSERRPDLPPTIDPVIERALAKSREDRYGSCEELAVAARASIGPVIPPPVERPDVAEQTAARGSRGVLLAGAGAAALLLLVVGALFAGAGGGDGTPSPAPPTSTSPSPVSSPHHRIVIAAAGEIACPQPPYVATDLDHCRYDSTSKLLDPGELTTVLALGDNQYDSGTRNEYVAYYNEWWGKARTITEPVPGDHDYNLNPSSHAHGYFTYWGTRVEGPDGYGYRSFNLPAGCTPGDRVCWHVIALNSELCLLPSGCGPAPAHTTPQPGNDMYRWLKHDLGQHPNDRYACTLAFWHHPLFSFSSGSGSTPEVQPLWDLLYRAGADVVLNSNSHTYQRWAPVDPSQRLDPKHGIREFINGLGGVKKDALGFGAWPAELLDAQDTSFGVLEMTLLRAGYTWRWVSAPGQPVFTDARTPAVSCH